MISNKLYTYQRLKDYALWYYFRYYPSNKRLFQKLQEKGSTEDSQKVFWDIQHLLQESEIIASKIDNYVFRNKNYRYIRQKMFEKWFPKESVEKYLEKYLTSKVSILDVEFLQRKIDTYARKWKSRRYIFQTLWETSQDREVLDQLLDQYFIDWEAENIKKHYNKLSQKYTREKCIQKLIEKWFRYDEIKKIID